MKNTTIRNILIFVVFLAVFLFGRWSGPKPKPDYSKKYDSLQTDLKAAQRALDLALDSAVHYKAIAQGWQDKAVEAQKSKGKTKIIYVKEIARIDSLDSAGVFARILARYR